MPRPCIFHMGVCVCVCGRGSGPAPSGRGRPALTAAADCAWQISSQQFGILTHWHRKLTKVRWCSHISINASLGTSIWLHTGHPTKKPYHLHNHHFPTRPTQLALAQAFSQTQLLLPVVLKWNVCPTATKCIWISESITHREVRSNINYWKNTIYCLLAIVEWAYMCMASKHNMN